MSPPGASDWEEFIRAVPWFVTRGAAVDVGIPSPWSRGAVDGLPILSHLLAAATVTRVEVEGRAYDLLVWGTECSRRGWLCLPPVPQPATTLHPAHQALLRSTGGIVERFGEPDSWWLNQNEVLTEAAAQVDLAGVLATYGWLWADEGFEIPINPVEFYVVAEEANGNLTMAHRTSGELMLFAPDHAFPGVTPLPGCPEFSLMTIDAAPLLANWIELTAEAWL